MENNEFEWSFAGEAAVRAAENRRAYQTWLRQFRHLDEEDEGALDVFSEMLVTVFLYFADGYKFGPFEERRSRVLGMRAWVLLYALRPDLLDGESMTDGARKFGVTRQSMQTQLENLRRYLPALEIDSESRRGREGNRVLAAERMSETRRGRIEQRKERWARKESAA